MAIFFWFLSIFNSICCLTISKQHNIIIWGVAVVILTLVGLAFEVKQDREEFVDWKLK